MAALGGWALLAAGGGGIDPGDGLGGPGPTAAFLGLALGAPLAVAAVALAWGRGALRAPLSLAALGAAAAIAAWSALSIVWAAGPDLAWIDANRAALSLAALVLGLSLGALLPRAPLWLGLGITAGAFLPVAIALGVKILPGALGSDRDLARLAEPVGYWNALALVAAMAAPGLLWLSGRRGWWSPVAGAGLSLVIVTVLLTYSRGGVLALGMAAGVTVAFLPRRTAPLMALAAAVIGAAWPVCVRAVQPAPERRPRPGGPARGGRRGPGMATGRGGSPSRPRWPRGSPGPQAGPGSTGCGRAPCCSWAWPCSSWRLGPRPPRPARAAGRATGCPSSAARAATPWPTTRGGW